MAADARRPGGFALSGIADFILQICKRRGLPFFWQNFDEYKYEHKHWRDQSFRCNERKAAIGPRRAWESARSKLPQVQGQGLIAEEEMAPPRRLALALFTMPLHEPKIIRRRPAPTESQYIAIADLVRMRMAISILGDVHRRAKVRTILKRLFKLELEMTRAVCPEWL